VNRHCTAPRATARSVLLMAATASTLLLASCSSNTSGGAADRGPITFAVGKDTSGNLQKQVDSWNTAHPTQKVTVNELPASADDQLQQLQQNAQVKSDAFAVLGLDVVWTPEFAANRWIDQLPASTDTSGLLPSAVDSATYRSHLYAVPWQTNGGMLFYRTDLLTAAGIASAPTTWSQMQDDCAKVKVLPQAKDVGCYAGQFDKYEGLVVNFSEAVQSAGGRVFDDSGKPTVDTPQARSALQWLATAFKVGTIPLAALTYKEEDGRKAFQDGNLVFLRQWPYVWDLANKTDGSSKVAGKFGVAALPGLGGPGSSTLGGYNLAVSAFAEHKATARDFIAYMTSDDAQRANLLATSTAPTRTDLYADTTLQQRFPYLAVLQKSLQTAVPRPKAVHYGDVSAAIQNGIAPVIAGQTDPATALTALQTKLQQVAAQQ